MAARVQCSHLLLGASGVFPDTSFQSILPRAFFHRWLIAKFSVIFITFNCCKEGWALGLQSKQSVPPRVSTISMLDLSSKEKAD